MDHAVARLARYEGRKIGYPDSVAPCMTVSEVVEVADHVKKLDIKIKRLEQEVFKWKRLANGHKDTKNK